MSRSTLCNRCDMVNASPKASLTLGRVLRTLVLADAATWHPETVMNTVDIRTLAAIMKAIGVEDYRAGGRPPLDAILIEPKWAIPVEIRAALGQWLRRHLPSL